MYLAKVLLATDGSEEPAPAARTAVKLANATGSELHAAHAGCVGCGFQLFNHVDGGARTRVNKGKEKGRGV